MIDWVTAKLSCRNSLRTGGIVKFDKDFKEEWTSQSWLPVQGSYDSSIVIKPITADTIQISGNPAKWLQGHNLFGTNDLQWLMIEFFSSLHEVLCDELNPTIDQLDFIEQGKYTVSRVDINETWHLKDQNEVKSWIRSAQSKIALARRGRGIFSGDTLYWGKDSKYTKLKCYSKGDEINSKKSNYPAKLRTPEMLDYADKALRIEVTACSRFLRETGLNMPCNWSKDTGKLILLDHIGKLEMSNNFRLSDDILNSLGTRMKMAYIAWFHGEDLRPVLPKNTFYRYRREFKKYDIDIAMVRDVDKPADNVVPLVKVLEAQPVGIPTWAFEQGLVIAPDYERIKPKLKLIA